MGARLARFLAVAAPPLLTLGLGGEPAARADEPPKPPARRCPAEMVRVHGYCIDRWESSLVDVTTGEPLSPYYAPVKNDLDAAYEYWQSERFTLGDEAAQRAPLPELPAWQREHTFSPRAVSRPGVVPQGYLSYYTAKKACTNAGKRLCTEKEWVTACEGERATKFPYGERYKVFACNVFRPYHPAFVLHQNSSLGHRDPRLNLVVEGEDDPLLRATGATPSCVSRWGADVIYDMVGNVDEWVEGEKRPTFVGGFYARSTTNGCEARVDSHAPQYYDYSLGTRCCADAAPSSPAAPASAAPAKATPAASAGAAPKAVTTPAPVASPNGVVEKN
jgi:sulfatase modifying factor 1